MFNKRDLFIVLIMVVLFVGTASFQIYYRESFTIGETKALIDDNKKIIFVSLPQGSSSTQKISFNFPSKNNNVYIKKLSHGPYIIDNPVEERLERGVVYDFGQFISHLKVIIKTDTSNYEYDLWVTTGDVPILTIDAGEDIPDEPKINCNIDLITGLESYNMAGIDAAIEQVDISEHIPKSSYSLNIKENPVTGYIPSILDFESSKRFKLSASYQDRSFIREKLLYDIFKTLSDGNIAPDSRYVELYLNGDYQGLYLLSQRVDRNMFSLSNFNQEDADHSVIYEATGWRADFTKGIEGFSQIEPDMDKDELYFEPLLELEDLIINTEKEEFWENIGRLVDVESVLDNHILFLFSGCTNELASNNYIYRGNYATDKFRFSPGSHYKESLGRSENSSKVESSNSFYGTRLYNRLYEDEKYRERLKERWNTLREDTLTLDNIYRLVDENAVLLFPAQARNFDRWPITMDSYPDDFGFSEDTEYIKKFIIDRIAFLDNHINNPPFFKIGNTYALINEEAGTIFCTLPQDSDTIQKIETNMNGELFIEPISFGINKVKNIYNENTFKEFNILFDQSVQTNDILIHIENTVENEVVNSTETISGWAVDPNSKTDTGVENIFIFDGPNLDSSNFLGKADYGNFKEGMAEYYNNINLNNSGFNLQLNTIFLENGYHQLYIYAYDRNGNFSLKILPVTVENDPGSIEKALKSKKEQVEKDKEYDFNDYIFHGQLTLVDNDCEKVYDLFVTTGKIPIMTIITNNDSIPDYPKIDGRIQLLSSTDLYNYNTEKIESTIEVRGGSGIFSEKKSYSFKFNRESSYDLEINYLDMTNARKWILNSCFLDRTLMRDKLSYDLFNQLRDEKHYDYASETRFVEVFINNSYEGLYLLSERIDEDLLRLADYNEKDEVHSVVYKSSSFTTEWQRWNSGIVAINPYKGATRIDREVPYDKLFEHQGYIQKEPNPFNEDQGNFWGPLLLIRELAIKSNDDYFSTYIENELDLSNTIDFHLLFLITGNFDGKRNNQYICRDNKEDSRFFFVPWDYNASFGRAVRTGKEPYTRWYSNDLLNRLLKIESYRNKYIERWNELRRSVFSYENIINMIDENSKLIKDAQKRNFEKFPIVVGENWLNDQYADNYSFSDDISFAKTWLEGRIKFLDYYIDNNLITDESLIDDAIKLDITYPEPYSEINSDLIIEGWAINTKMDDSPGISEIIVYLEDIGEKGISIENAEFGFEREDVSERFNNENYKYSGFKMEIEDKILKNGKNFFWVLAFDESGKYNIDSISLDYSRKEK